MADASLTRWSAWLFAAAVAATRLPFMTRTPYAFDSANFALAVRDYYNVAHHRPHPPGYPLYVAAGWLINQVVGDANRALVLLSILLSMVAVVGTVYLARALYGGAASVLAGLLLLFMVGFWGYGEVAYAYVGLAAEGASLALLAHGAIAGRRWLVVPLGFGVGVAAGIRWDGAVFSVPLWLWALAGASWRLRLASVVAATAVAIAWAVPMVALSGGPAAYLAAIDAYLKVWAPQSAYVVGDFASGQATLATYNLNFFVNYSRQMLGVGILLALYALGRRLGPLQLATDYRARFLLVWTLPPILTYVFTHLGEPGYVLSLAPQVALLAAVAILDLGRDTALATASLRARGVRGLPEPTLVGRALVVLLATGIVGWNVQAFLRGTGPGRLPDLRTRDATTLAQVEFLRAQPAGGTLVLAHDTIRQLEYYLPGERATLLYDEYSAGWESARTQTPLPPSVRQVVVLDAPLQLPESQRSLAREVTLVEQPRVTAWVIDTNGATAVEHGYRFVRLVTD